MISFHQTDPGGMTSSHQEPRPLVAGVSHMNTCDENNTDNWMVQSTNTRTCLFSYLGRRQLAVLGYICIGREDVRASPKDWRLYTRLGASRRSFYFPSILRQVSQPFHSAPSFSHKVPRFFLLNSLLLTTGKTKWLYWIQAAIFFVSRYTKQTMRIIPPALTRAWHAQSCSPWLQKKQVLVFASLFTFFCCPHCLFLSVGCLRSRLSF